MRPGTARKPGAILRKCSAQAARSMLGGKRYWTIAVIMGRGLLTGSADHHIIAGQCQEEAAARGGCAAGSPLASFRLIYGLNREVSMRRWRIYIIFAGIVGLLTGPGAPAQTPVAQPTSEGHPHKWQTIDKSLFDLVADGYKLVSVAYDASQTAAGAEPDVHYFLEKGNIVARCDF